MESSTYIILNDLRTRLRTGAYDPVSGLGAFGHRLRVDVPGAKGATQAFIPLEMANDPAMATVNGNFTAWQRLRCRHDFEYWCATCAYIRQKTGGRPAPCRPNDGQRAVIAALESARRAGRPMRLIVLKARQWGCTTIIQLYIAWLQTCLCTEANALICAHRKDSAAAIRGMYTRLLARHPPELWQADSRPRLVPYEGSADIKRIDGLDCTIAVASCRNEDSVRGFDIALAHLTEVAYWQESEGYAPEDVVQAVYGTVAVMPGTLVALESTANGVGNFFHREWLRSKNGAGDKTAVFVPWHEIAIYTAEPDDATAFADSLSPDEKVQWNAGLTLQQLYWQRCKRLEIGNDERFKAEFPSDDIEAFTCRLNTVFDPAKVEALRGGCSALRIDGELNDAATRFVPDRTGKLAVWEKPHNDAAYVVAVDVGGRSAAADWSVIAVVKRGSGAELPEVVAQWRGHIDHDILALKAVAIARYYRNALLVVESNTFETSGDEANYYILTEMARKYHNMYMRRNYDRERRTNTYRYGFHTNRRTKPALIGNLIATVREGAYVERDPQACDEMLHYEQLDNGGFGARAPYHDDILMTRAIALYVIATEPASSALPAHFRQPDRW